MTRTQTAHKHERAGWLQHIRQWLPHPKSEVLPTMFGDVVPPDLKMFEAEVEEARHEIQEVPAPPAVRAGRSKPARRK